MSDFLDNELNNEKTETSAQEGSYEWNAPKDNSGEYHYSYVNGNNENAPHNPNNYESAYSTEQASYDGGRANTEAQNYETQGQDANGYTDYANTQSYGGYQYNQSYQGGFSEPPKKAKKPKKTKVKKEKKPASRGFVAAVLAISIIASGALGFGGGYLANNMNKTTDGDLTINRVEANNTSSNKITTGTTSEIVKKTANSVVEIVTESVVNGSFAQQYVQQGAGSGVIISSDGYIITNHHVIDGANNIKVTLRDGKTSYNAAVIGSDSDNDIALIKVDAKEELSPATFGDSASLAVGDYVVAIGNPLGELGGTVTDGIISALAREVTIEKKNMTLLQTNAQISPGNSGGGLFNANGELVGIVNAKDSATEVEGIGFAIPINNVLDIINDLKSYGYVTGKIDLGMQLTDITSNDSAFYYGLSQTGCYVLSVTRGSNAEQAGFVSGDLITKVGDTEVSSKAEVEKALENAKVGDVVKFSVYRSRKTVTLNLTLEEYVPSDNITYNGPTNGDNNTSDEDFWSQIFGW